ncbi:MAG: hypothetical protein MSH60_01705 [Ruminococcus sp.]|nr:hypothetical protein [Ruminococcus sp.]
MYTIKFDTELVGELTGIYGRSIDNFYGMLPELSAAMRSIDTARGFGIEDIAKELQSAVATSIAEKYLPKDNIFVPLKSGEFGEEIKKAYDHYSGENKKKNSAKWIDVELAYYIKECYDNYIDPDGIYNLTGSFTPSCMSMFLAMFYCEICKFKFKSKFDYYAKGIKIEDKEAEIVYNSDDGKKEYTAEELLNEINVYDANGANYHDDWSGEVFNVEAIGYLAKIINLFADDNEKMNFKNMDVIDVAKSFTERYELEEFFGTINDYNVGQDKVISYAPYINYEDYDFDDRDSSFMESNILHIDDLYAILKTFWKRFVDPEAE